MHSREIRKKHGLSLENIPGYLVAMFISLTIAATISLGIQVMLDKFLPVKYYVQYDAIKTEFNEYQIDTKEIKVYSYNRWLKNNLLIEWHDELFCSNGVEWEGIGSQPWDSARNKQDNTTIPVRWVLRIPLPSYETECKIISNVSVGLEYGRKSLRHESNTFKVINRYK